MPKARSFQGIALTSPGVNQGDVEGGFQVNGASGAENSFTVDGVNTNSLLYGSSRQDTVFEYLQEVQVKTGGIAAEYGGALGGVISAVTKSGGNRFTGEGHYYYSGSAISASPVPAAAAQPARRHDGPQRAGRRSRRTIATRSADRIGGPIVKDKLFFFGSVSPRFVRRDERLPVLERHRARIDSAEADGDAGVRQGHVTRRAACRRTAACSPRRCGPTGTLTAYDGTGPQFVSSSLAGNAAQIPRGFNQDQTNVSGNVDIYLSGAASISVRGGLFTDNYADTGVSTTTAVIWNTPSIGVAGVPANLQLPEGRPEHAARAHHEQGPDADQLHPGRLQPRIQRRRLAPDQGRLRRAAHDQRSRCDLSRRLRPPQLGHVVRQQQRPDRHRHLRVLRGERPRHPRRRQRQHAVAVRAGHLVARQSR